MNLLIKKFFPTAILPTRAHPTDAGLDLYSLEDVFIEHGTTERVRTGIAVDIPPGHVGKIEDRSSLAAKGLRTGGGVVDPGYHGDVTVVLHNLSNTSVPMGRYGRGYNIQAGDKIAQLVIYAVEHPEVFEVQQFGPSDRGEKGFGSSGA